ncbi:TerC family protein [Planctomicrobium sp. SH668]|uniref:TerC family protein n=1 Tax=Planctomicrobium sp. SH668 TaxID=3448126 RepID=UPI003F5C3143
MDWVIPLLTLTAMEIVLGIDNIVFISILVQKLPEAQRAFARTLGLSLAMGMRLVLLFCITWVLSLATPIFHVTDLGIPAGWIEAMQPQGDDALAATEAKHRFDEMNGISVRDLIMLLGGLFLIGNSVLEIHHKLDGANEKHTEPKKVTLKSILIQITLMDIIFSLDSVITAVGMAKEIWVMCTAVIISIGIMIFFAGTVERFVNKNPTVKMLALSFLILIGVLLVAEGLGTHMNKGYIYFAMAFSLAVEMINIRLRRATESNVPANPAH